MLDRDSGQTVTSTQKHDKDIIVDIHLYGQENHTSYLAHRRPTRRAEREDLKKELGEFTPTHVYTQKMSTAHTGKLMSGNFNEVPSITVIQKISSEKNLQDRLHNNTFLDLLLLQQTQDTQATQTSLHHHYIQLIGMSPFTVHM